MTPQPKHPIIPMKVSLPLLRDPTDGDRLLDDLHPYVDSNNLGVGIGVNGYSNANQDNGVILHIEYYEGKLMLRVWADINQEDPTHVIPLGLAHMTKRKQAEPPPPPEPVAEQPELPNNDAEEK